MSLYFKNPLSSWECGNERFPAIPSDGEQDRELTNPEMCLNVFTDSDHAMYNDTSTINRFI